VEAKGKLSPTLTNWLLERIPVVPRCSKVNAFDGAEVVVNHEPPSALGVTDFSEEAEWSREYWSNEFQHSSWDRLRNWSWSPVDAIFADPRTFHGSAALPR
jgi:hypothetical protein